MHRLFAADRVILNDRLAVCAAQED